ncbi:hypothetical protein [Actinoplanes sp. NPDC026670]|uniref:hypothetical protein n=1 Tax=Actinoplanes sp. NPDC026670 TaxID=3154700 RepID=UPI0033D9E9F5
MGCSGLITTPISPMPPSLPNTEEGTTFYLPNAGTYQLAFSWQITDPGWANSVATTQTFGSIRFHCEQLGPDTDPGQCYFRGLSPA